MKFAVSYSFGKDSALALLKMLDDGHELVALVVAVNDSQGRTWTHGVSSEVMARIADAIGLPIIVARSVSADEYAALFENALRKAKELGADACVYGDMDIDAHLTWNKERCANAGLECIVPLWGVSRETAVYEAIERGIEAVVKVVERKYLGEEFLAKTLTLELLDSIRTTGADVCGENGEFHTIVLNAPFFRHRADVQFGDVVDLGAYASIELL